jgi:hypothetical protein
MRNTTADSTKKPLERRRELKAVMERVEGQNESVEI